MRIEILPIELFRQRERPVAAGPAGRETLLASAACLMGRYALVERPGTSFFVEAGTGPLYAYSYPVPPGGTRGNFFDQIGIGVRRGPIDVLARVVHVSNLNIGPRGAKANPGFSFETIGVAWRFR